VPKIDYSDSAACMRLLVEYLEKGKYFQYRDRLHPNAARVVSTKIYETIQRTHGSYEAMRYGLTFTDAAMARRIVAGMCGSDSDAKEMMKMTPQHFTNEEFKAMNIRRRKAKAL